MINPLRFLNKTLQGPFHSAPSVQEAASGVLTAQERSFCLGGQRKALGQWAEDKAAEFLSQQGLSILGRNLRCGPLELDILCRDGSEWAFVEVRCRKENAYQSAENTLGPQKLGRLIRGAAWYVARQGWQGNWRIDLIAIDVKRTGPWRLQWFSNVELEGGMDRGF